MKYDDIVPSTGTLPPGYPVLAHITVDPVDLFRFTQLVGDSPCTRIIGHDDPSDGMVTVSVACASDEVKRRLEDGWG
jgi:hypothetical protein